METSKGVAHQQQNELLQLVIGSMRSIYMYIYYTYLIRISLKPDNLKDEPEICV